MKTKHHKTGRHEDDTTTEESNSAAEATETHRRPATEPWDAENAAGSPKRHGLLGLPKTKKGYELRWVRYDSIDRRKNQGYSLATPEDFDATPDENGMIRRNELVLMTVPKDVYDARRQQNRKQAELQATSAKREFLTERDKASRETGHNMRDNDRDEE